MQLRLQDDIAVQHTVAHTHVSDDKAHEMLTTLHHQIYPLFFKHSIDLHPVVSHRPVCLSSVSTCCEQDVLTLQYTRSYAQAALVERLMGRDDMINHSVDVRHHPVIEVRVMPSFIAVELIVSPYAWWDQQNFIGKISIERHRQRFFRFIQSLDSEAKIGFWRGTQLEGLDVQVGQLKNPRVWNDLMDTFDAGKDWFRIGMWHTQDLSELLITHSPEQWVHQINQLYVMYNDLIWSSNNSYRDFYHASRKWQAV
jgi:hypothetical protein